MWFSLYLFTFYIKEKNCKPVGKSNGLLCMVSWPGPCEFCGEPTRVWFTLRMNWGHWVNLVWWVFSIAWANSRFGFRWPRYDGSGPVNQPCPFLPSTTSSTSLLPNILSGPSTSIFVNQIFSIKLTSKKLYLIQTLVHSIVKFL